MIVAACDKPEAKPPTNIEKDEKADTDTDSEGESGGGEEDKAGADGGEPADGDADKTGGESGGDGEEVAPAAYSFAFGEASYKVAFTAGTYTKAVVETNKPAGDARNIEYTSSETKIAPVDDAGVVTFIKTGTVTITATKTAESGHDKATARYTLYITMKPTNKAELVDEITRAMDAHGNTVDLNYIDTSAITDMSWLFSKDRTYGYGRQAFNGDISEWDVSKVTAMFNMFMGATSFNGDISGWNVARVTNMSGMFSDATSFNGDISGWNVVKVTNMNFMFHNATSFKYNIDAWGERLNARVKADLWVNTILMFRKSGLANKLPSWCQNANCRNRQ